MNKIIDDNKKLAKIIITLQIILLLLLLAILFLAGVSTHGLNLSSDEYRLFRYMLGILCINTLAHCFLKRIGFVATGWINFFKSLLLPLWIILLIIFNGVLVGKIIPLSEFYPSAMGIIGVIASLLGIIYAFYINDEFNKKFDYRVKRLAHDECFSKLADLLLAKDVPVPEVGLPPEKHIAIVNRNSLIPAFWVDPLEYRNIKWRKFIDALCLRMTTKVNIKLELHLPLDCKLCLAPGDANANADEYEYFKVMNELAKLTAENILSHVNGSSINKSTQEDIYSKTKGMLPTCYKFPLKLLGRTDKDKYITEEEIYRPACFFTEQREFEAKSCSSCEYKIHCFDLENLKHSCLIIYCSFVMELFNKIKHLSENRTISIQHNRVDKGIQFPLLIFFDAAEGWSRERSKVLMTVIHQRVITQGEFSSYLMFPWDIVKGLRKTVSNTNDHSNENINIKEKLDSIIADHRFARNVFVKTLSKAKHKKLEDNHIKQDLTK